MSKLGARPLTHREWDMLDHMVRTGGWIEGDPPPFDTDDCPELVMTLGRMRFCYVDRQGQGLIAPLGIAYHRWNRTRWPRAASASSKRDPGWKGEVT